MLVSTLYGISVVNAITSLVIELGESFTKIAVAEDFPERLTQVRLELSPMSKRLTKTQVAVNKGSFYFGDSAVRWISSKPLSALPNMISYIGISKEQCLKIPVLTCEPKTGILLPSDTILDADSKDNFLTPVGYVSRILDYAKAYRTTTDNSIGSTLVVATDITTKGLLELKEAASLAGINLRRILRKSEGFMTELARASQKDEEKNVMVVHLGGGHLEVAVGKLSFVENKIHRNKFVPKVEMLGISVSREISGQKLDFAIRNLIYKDILKSLNFDSLTDLEENLLLAAIVKARHRLSVVESASVSLKGCRGGKSASTTITREELKKISAEMIEVLKNSLQEAIDLSNLQIESIQNLYTSGGAIRTPWIETVVMDWLKSGESTITKLDTRLNADESIISGSAYRSAQLEQFKTPNMIIHKSFYFDYTLKVVSLNDPNKDMEVKIYKKGEPFIVSKVFSMQAIENLRVDLYEEKELVASSTITGIEEKIKSLLSPEDLKLTYTIQFNKLGIPSISSASLSYTASELVPPPLPVTPKPTVTEPSEKTKSNWNIYDMINKIKSKMPNFDSQDEEKIKGTFAEHYPDLVTEIDPTLETDSTSTVKDNSNESKSEDIKTKENSIKQKKKNYDNNSKEEITYETDVSNYEKEQNENSSEAVADNSEIENTDNTHDNSINDIDTRSEATTTEPPAPVYKTIKRRVALPVTYIFEYSNTENRESFINAITTTKKSAKAENMLVEIESMVLEGIENLSGLNQDSVMTAKEKENLSSYLENTKSWLTTVERPPNHNQVEEKMQELKGAIEKLDNFLAKEKAKKMEEFEAARVARNAAKIEKQKAKIAAQQAARETELAKKAQEAEEAAKKSKEESPDVSTENQTSDEAIRTNTISKENDDSNQSNKNTENVNESDTMDRSNKEMPKANEL